MGKKIKKKTRSAYKEKRVSSNSACSNSEHSNPTQKITDEKALEAKGKKSCGHVDNSVDLDKITWNISSPGNVKCEDCRNGAIVDQRPGKGKGKQAKKKGVGSMDGKSEQKCLWVCLSCGHVACGGATGDLTLQSHSIRHSRQNRHPCAIQLDDPFLCWCFVCNSLLPVEKQEENEETNGILSDIKKLIKGQHMKGAVLDVEDVWFGAGNVEGHISEVQEFWTSCARGYRVRGLSNLGNTCFFNSILQNLLAMDLLRTYVMDLDQSVGPLTMAFRKLFAETNVDADSKNGTNPKSLFGCICSKAPQFRGYQQQDSHELLRYLLDGLHTEELNARKSLASTSEDGFASKTGSTFVDNIFGGQLSSTICCTECGHSSIVYEPFLDLSLPVPTKKSPPAKGTVSQPKKKKMGLKERNKGGKIRESRNDNIVPTSAQTAKKIVNMQSECSESSSTLTSRAPDKEQAPLSEVVDILSRSDCIGPVTAKDKADALVVDDSLSWMDNTRPDTTNKPAASPEAEDAFSWLDYIEPNTTGNDGSSVSRSCDASIIHDSGCRQGVQNENITHYDSEVSCVASSLNMQSQARMESYVDNHSSDEIPLCVQDSQVLLLPYKEEVLTVEETERTMTCCQIPDKIESQGTPVKDLSAAASSINGWDDAEQDFNGFGDLFNEPEIVSKPNDSSFQATDETEMALLTGNSSESNQEEIDNTNAPVSIDSCLAYFTKPELLSDEHAWHCESCSKSLKQQKSKAKKEEKKAVARNNSAKTCEQANDVKRSVNSEPIQNSEHLHHKFGKFDIPSESAPQKLPSPAATESRRAAQEFGWSGSVMGSDLLSNGVADHCRISQVGGYHGDVKHTPHERASVRDQTHCHMTSVDSSENPCSPGSDSLSGGGETQKQESCLLSREQELNDGDTQEIDGQNEKVKRNASKRYLISKAPHILTIHLKRFSQDACGRLSKLSGHVCFADTLDLWPYMDPRCVEKEKYRYRLIGVVEHSGTMRGGHYIAYIKVGRSTGKATEKEVNSTWFYASDAYIREVSLTDVLQSEAYILFYEKI